MAFKGADAPPHVILHGPSGQVFDTGSGNAPVQAKGFAALKNDELDITEIVIEKPAAAAGRSRRPRTRRGSCRASRPTARAPRPRPARSPAPATTAARLHGQGPPGRRPRRVRRGRRRRRRADRRRQGRRPRHAEVPPRRGRPGKREIQGVVYGADGFLTARLELGTYTAPAPQRPAKAKKLTLRRSGKRLVLRWRGEGVSRQQVDIRSAAGLNMTRTVKRSTTSIALPAARTKLVITVTGRPTPGLAGTGRPLHHAVPAKK